MLACTICTRQDSPLLRRLASTALLKSKEKSSAPVSRATWVKRPMPQPASSIACPPIFCGHCVVAKNRSRLRSLPMWLSSCVLSKVFHWYPKLWAYPSLGTNRAMERTTGNSRPHDMQVSFPSLIVPPLSAGEAESARRVAPHPMHLNHSTDFKFIPRRSSLTSIHSPPHDPI